MPQVVNIQVLDGKLEIAKFYNWVFLENHVTSIEYQGKQWYPYTTMWYGHEGPRPDYDPDDGRYANVYSDSENQGENDHDLIHPSSYEEIRHHFDEEEKLQNRMVELKHKLILHHSCGINSDIRGTNRMALDLDDIFTGKCVIEPGVYPILDVMNIMWRVKGNKFDNWYELFSRIVETEDTSDGNPHFSKRDRNKILDRVVFLNGCWDIECCVDHGS